MPEYVATAAPGSEGHHAEAGAGEAHPAAAVGGLAAMVGALGIVFGDIGTSPLYAFQTVFMLDRHAVKPTHSDVLGVVSLMVWSLTLIVTIKYVLVVMRADNDGEGGVLVLAALVRRVLRTPARRAAAAMILGVLGASLFYGDSVITPAISVLSAVEGLKVAAPSVGSYVLPIALVILIGLFSVQRFGTGRVGAAFGPVMLVWFAVLAVAGTAELIRNLSVLQSLSPWNAATFVLDHPVRGFLTMGAIVLGVTGAEALYADMGHFGRAPIRRAWLGVAFPALLLNYLGQGALILRHPRTVTSPFFLLMPGWARVATVALATMATVIASQAVISGAFSVTRQAVQLGYLTPVRMRLTSEEIGQVYVPVVNTLLCVGVVALIVGFRTSEHLAVAYGVAVTGTLLITTVLLLVQARVAWRWQWWRLALAAALFGGLELAFFAANTVKISRGGWLPLVIAGSLFTVMTTWQRGRALITERREQAEGPLSDFLDELHCRHVHRQVGTAVFPHPGKNTTPLALRANVEHNGVLHERVVIVSAVTENVPHVPRHAQVEIDHLGDNHDGVTHVTVHLGFMDPPDLPRALHAARDKRDPELDFDVDTATYFLSRANIVRGHTGHHEMPKWRARLFELLAHNAANPAEYFHLPIKRTIVMGTQIDL